MQIVKYGRPLEVKIVRLIGPANQAGVDVTAILYENNIRQEFPHEVIQEVENVPSTVQKSDLEGRTDYRYLYTVTIDGDDSKDFDDAISIERTKDGYRLYVHIADVSNYVKENAPLIKKRIKRNERVCRGSMRTDASFRIVEWDLLIESRCRSLNAHLRDGHQQRRCGHRLYDHTIDHSLRQTMHICQSQRRFRWRRRNDQRIWRSRTNASAFEELAKS